MENRRRNTTIVLRLRKNTVALHDKLRLPLQALPRTHQLLQTLVLHHVKMKLELVLEPNALTFMLDAPDGPNSAIVLPAPTVQPPWKRIALFLAATAMKSVKTMLARMSARHELLLVSVRRILSLCLFDARKPASIVIDAQICILDARSWPISARINRLYRTCTSTAELLVDCAVGNLVEILS